MEAADPGGWVLTLSDLGKCWGDKQNSDRVQVSVIQMIGSIVCLSCGPVAGADGAINMSQCMLAPPRPHHSSPVQPVICGTPDNGIDKIVSLGSPGLL